MDFKDYIRAEVYKSRELSVGKKIIARYFEPSTNAVFLIRKLLYWGEKKNNKFFKYIATYKCVKYRSKLTRRYGIFVGENADIGIGLRMPHPNGIIIGANHVGANVTIYQQVTIGSAHIGDYKKNKQPVIGDNCVLFAGSKIIGDIKLAESAVVGANSVLTKNTMRGVHMQEYPQK